MPPAFQFDRVLFFGRGLSEYRVMFNFVPEDFAGKRVLDCCAGPSAFTATAPSLNIDVIACDPLYELPMTQLRQRIDEDYALVESLQARTTNMFHEALRPAEQRRRDVEPFLQDFEQGRKHGRYVAAGLPKLPFPDGSFELTLCGNFLFLYSDVQEGGLLTNSPFGFDFHRTALLELCRVTTGETRIYPLHGPHVERHGFLDELCADLRSAGIETQLVPVQHKDIKTATTLLSARRVQKVV